MKKYIVIDVGGTAIKYGLIDEAGQILEKHERPTERQKGGQKILEKVLGIVEAYNSDDTVSGVCISTAGMVDVKSGEIFYASSLIPGYIGVNYKKEIENRFHLPCEVENDVNCAGLAEYTSGASEGAHSAIMLTIGTGIGGCLVYNDHVYHGFSNSACEVGYMKIGCGRFEQQAAASVMSEQVAKEKGETAELWDGKRIFEAAKNQDEVCIRAIETLVDHLAEGIANICYVVNPEKVVLGGGIMAQEEYLSGLINTALDRYLVSSIREKTTIAFAHYKNDAGMLGAFYNFMQRQQKH